MCDDITPEMEWARKFATDKSKATSHFKFRTKTRSAVIAERHVRA
jgi:hypothetical protein